MRGEAVMSKGINWIDAKAFGQTIEIIYMLGKRRLLCLHDHVVCVVCGHRTIDNQTLRTAALLKQVQTTDRRINEIHCGDRKFQSQFGCFVFG